MDVVEEGEVGGIGESDDGNRLSSEESAGEISEDEPSLSPTPDDHTR